MRTTPCCGGEDDLDLLSSRETAHRVVSDKLGLESKVGHVELNLSSDERTEETGLLGLARVDLHDLYESVSSVRNDKEGRRRTFFSNPRLMRSSRGNQMFSDDDIPLNAHSYSNDCLSFLRLMTSSIVRLTPSTTTVEPSFIFFSSSSESVRFALESSSRSSPVW